MQDIQIISLLLNAAKNHHPAGLVQKNLLPIALQQFAKEMIMCQNVQPEHYIKCELQNDANLMNKLTKITCTHH